jgi:hypothetical protein
VQRKSIQRFLGRRRKVLREITGKSIVKENAKSADHVEVISAKKIERA